MGESDERSKRWVAENGWKRETEEIFWWAKVSSEVVGNFVGKGSREKEGASGRKEQDLRARASKSTEASPSQQTDKALLQGQATNTETEFVLQWRPMIEYQLPAKRRARLW